MSTTPPKKGKKRQAPLTPHGTRPPAKGHTNPATTDDNDKPLQYGSHDLPTSPIAPIPPYNLFRREVLVASSSSGSATAPMDIIKQEEVPAPGFQIPTVTRGNGNDSFNLLSRSRPPLKPFLEGGKRRNWPRTLLQLPRQHPT